MCAYGPLLGEVIHASHGPSRSPPATATLGDPSGKLNFAGKAVLHADGADFSSGNSYKINMAELELREGARQGPSHSPYIVEFYGAFFIESCVYYCMEYMGRGFARPVDSLQGMVCRKDVLSRIAFLDCVGAPIS
ncbi:hypothetical protein AMAG_20015 [Allomyces macrogynus ATCC 38327]|uniref:Uncharacterized protein n=1 Tax=Allomyces macrogynus (strain ATCC 38327) TaxID=578462 RepID=A0A0L0T4P5_ALLM3|nr:hypothetical protein AMAG_20015 [Allomyces macrogynus ATCC 38327]|eukprot:KNE69681.1 hypothetical protein AMAG_20015 [Allomyces macrogynus ATCC 38327]